jgi:hypothetical protein
MILAPKCTRMKNRLETHAAAIEVCRELAALRLAVASLPSIDRFTQLQLKAVRVLALDDYDLVQDQKAKMEVGEPFGDPEFHTVKREELGGLSVDQALKVNEAIAANGELEAMYEAILESQLPTSQMA